MQGGRGGDDKTVDCPFALLVEHDLGQRFAAQGEGDSGVRSSTDRESLAGDFEAREGGAVRPVRRLGRRGGGAGGRLQRRGADQTAQQVDSGDLRGALSGAAGGIEDAALWLVSAPTRPILPRLTEATLLLFVRFGVVVHETPE